MKVQKFKRSHQFKLNEVEEIQGKGVMERKKFENVSKA